MILTRLKQLVGTFAKILRARFLQRTTPLTASLPLQTLADLGRSKSELVAENALLRQQLIILKRQVKRPACTKTDRVLLVFLARVVRTWKQGLFIVQPETLLRLPSGALPPVLETQVKGLCWLLVASVGQYRPVRTPRAVSCCLSIPQRKSTILSMHQLIFIKG